jgi:molybdate transport system regulatory protein
VQKANRTTLTGHELLGQFRIIYEEHGKFLKNLDQRMGDFGSLCQFLRRISMKVSARNLFNGTVTAIAKGAVNTEVSLRLKSKTVITAIVTNGAIDNLGLKEGMDAFAIVKASSVIIGTDLAKAKLSTRNLLTGIVTKLLKGPVSCEVDIELPGGTIVSSVITQESAERLGLVVGGPASALFKASSVILGVS